MEQSLALSPTLMLASFTNAEGFSMTVVCAHFSHIHIVRQAQWTYVGIALDQYSSPYCVLLADHNSFVVQVRDAPHPAEEELDTMLSARDTEILALTD